MSRIAPVSSPNARKRMRVPVIGGIERDPQVDGRALDDLQGEHAAGVVLRHLDDRDELLAARAAVDLAQARADAERTVGQRNGRDRVGLPGGQALGIR